MFNRITSLVMGLAFGIIAVVLLLSRVNAQSASICKDPGDEAWVIEGRTALWNTIEAGLLMQPKDLKLKAIGMTYANDAKTAGYYVMTSQPAHQKWVFVYPTLDPPGQPQGIHDFCMVWIYDLSQ